jgi:hypothetical protein
MKNKTRKLLWVSILPQLLFIYYIRRNPEWVESYYSEKVYPLISKLHFGFFNLLPFSAGDILYFFIFFFQSGISINSSSARKKNRFVLFVMSAL